jgi:hypothetical protein
MALTQTTLASACGAGDTKITVASATGFAAGSPVRVDGELMQVAGAYVAGSTTVPVLRGQQGTYAYAHPTSAKALVGAASDTAWGAMAPGTIVPYPIAGRATTVDSYSASGAITLPDPGSDKIAYLNGTSVLAMTIADPGKQLDGSRLSIRANGAAAHTLTFASGLSGTGASGSYDVITMNGTGPISLDFVAVNGAWQALVQTPMAGTVTNITGTVA